MNLGELKSALSKISPDMDDADVLIQTGYDGKTDYDLLTFLARIDDDRFRNCIVLGTLEAMRILVKDKKAKVPDDYVPGEKMTPQQAIEYMKETGKPVKATNAEVYEYWQLFRNDRVLMLFSDTACAARVWVNSSIEEFLTDPYEYESFDPETGKDLTNAK